MARVEALPELRDAFRHAAGGKPWNEDVQRVEDGIVRILTDRYGDQEKDHCRSAVAQWLRDTANKPYFDRIV